MPFSISHARYLCTVQHSHPPMTVPIPYSFSAVSETELQKPRLQALPATNVGFKVQSRGTGTSDNGPASCREAHLPGGPGRGDAINS